MVGGDLEAVAVDVPVDANLQVDAPRLSSRSKLR
jgi:hypothetical protein